MAIAELLTTWGFADLIPAFIEHEINENCLLELSDDMVKELIPKIGPRTVFLKHLNTYKALSKSIIIISKDSELNLQNFNVNSETETVSSLELSNTSSSFDGEQILPSTSGSSADVIPQTSDEIAQAYVHATSKLKSFYGPTQFKQSCRLLYHFDLYKFLSSSTGGQYILSFYEDNKMLNRKTRNMLVELLINGVMTDTKCENLKSEDFEILAQKISDLFKSEKISTYYIPQVSSKVNPEKKYVNPKGKLVDKFRNLKHLYKLSSPTTTTRTDEDQSEVPNLTEDIVNSADWLKNWSTPWELVLDNWEKTFPMRRLNKSTTLEEFITDWPILKINKAPTLIEMDFKKMFPECKINLVQDYNKWNVFFEKLRNIKGEPNKSTEQLLMLLNSATLNQDSRNALQIMLLAGLFPPRTVLKINKKHWKPSISECQESIIHHVHVAGNIETYIDERSKKLQHLQVTPQPFILVVGSSLTNITDSYLIICDILYKTDNVLGCLDLAFKSFHTLSARYPIESEHIWVLIQHAVYNIKTNWDKEIPYVTTLLESIKDS